MCDPREVTLLGLFYLNDILKLGRQSVESMFPMESSYSASFVQRTREIMKSKSVTEQHHAGPLS